MQTLYLTYPTFKECATDLKIYWHFDGAMYHMATASGDQLLITRAADEDIADFEAIKVGANECASIDDACAKSLWDPKNKERLNIRQKPFSAITRELRIQGWRHEATLDSDSTLDIQFPEDREIQGASIEVKNFTDGDYIEFYVILPAGAMGPGSPEVELVEWAETLYLGPSGIKGYDANDAKTLPAGIIVRLKYHSVATTGPNPILYLDVKMWK